MQQLRSWESTGTDSTIPQSLRTPMGQTTASGIGTKNLLSFCKQGGKPLQIQILVRNKAEIISARSPLTELPAVGLQQRCTLFHQRQIDAYIVLLKRNPHSRPIDGLPGSDCIL